MAGRQRLNNQLTQELTIRTKLEFYSCPTIFDMYKQSGISTCCPFPLFLNGSLLFHFMYPVVSLSF